MEQEVNRRRKFLNYLLGTSVGATLLAIFYPVMNEEYAIQIARDWNLPASGSGFVTRRAGLAGRAPMRR